MTENNVDVLVIGGGICGLAAAHELHTQTRNRVALLESGAVPGAQSQGSGRIFRHLHGSHDMVDYANQARQAWYDWEDSNGGPLLLRRGLLFLADRETVHHRARLLAAEELRYELIDEVKPVQGMLGSSSGPALLDRDAAVIDTDATVRFLSEDLGDEVLYPGHEVVDARQLSGHWEVRTPQHTWRAERVLVCGGLSSARIAELFGIQLALPTPRRTVRFTFDIRPADNAPGCLIDKRPLHPSYRLHTPQGLAVGFTSPGLEPVVEYEPEDTFIQRAQAHAISVLSEEGIYHGQEIREVVSCVWPDMPNTAGWDGWSIIEKGQVKILFGANLYKFAPLLARMLAA